MDEIDLEIDGDARKARQIEQRIEMGRRIKAARNAANLSLESVGFRMGKTKGAVGHWETGRSVIGAHELGELAQMFGVTSDSLIFGVSDSQSLRTVDINVYGS